MSFFYKYILWQKSKKVEKLLNFKLKTPLNDKEKRCINIFQKRAAEFIESKALKFKSSNNTPIRMRICFEISKPETVIIELPPEEQLDSLCRKFRFFYGDREASNFDRVANILKRHIEDKEFRDCIDNLKDNWNGKNAIKWSIIDENKNELNLTTQYLIDAWFNGNYFHSDEDKEQQLNHINKFISTRVNQYLFFDSVFQSSQSIINLHALMNQLISESTLIF